MSSEEPTAFRALSHDQTLVHAPATDGRVAGINSAVRDHRIVRAIEFVSNNLARRPALAEVARRVGLEKAHLCRLFRREVGMTFSSWNRLTRIERAKEFLKTTIAPIETIALAVGYEDLTTFERNFRRCEHIAPRQYRRAWLSRTATQSAKNATVAENNATNAETEERFAK